ncbi:MAG: leucine--tRNA ligase, partial [Candidatus Nanopelagicales bacterium]|nr:leucine--tRNA ligase [Candidatus Nanopelagicales bacterium]
MNNPKDNQELNASLDIEAVQAKWLPIWEKKQQFNASNDPDDDRPRIYVLDMFSYPSGDLHMGHAEAFAIGDVVSRYYFQKGYNVFHPVGWDSFGLPAENAAIKRGENPAKWTYANIETQAESFKRYAISFDWSHRLHTSDPEYYKWTQWLFLQLYKKGLAYRKASNVNWCPSCQTVLANEQVVAGACERCSAVVTKRELTQWYFKITDYSQRLLDDMEQLEGKWPERVLTMQKNWIGKSEGAYVDFQIEGLDKPVTVFTTRPDTLFGATFFVVAADSKLAQELVLDDKKIELNKYVEEVRKSTDIERLATDRPKTGIFLGRFAINPVNQQKIQVWASDYVLADYGTGAIMAVPAHDQRELDFAKAFKLPIQVVVETGEADPATTGVATPGDGKSINSGSLDGLDKVSAIKKINEILEKNKQGKSAVNFRLR